MATGRVVVLSGPSSSGTSTLSRALVDLLPGSWFLVPVDAVNAMRSTAPGLDGEALAAVLRRTRLGYHRAVAGLAAAGNDVVMDYPLSEPWRLVDLLEVLCGLEVTLVEVTCDVEELERRERARGDRPAGLARSQVEACRLPDRDLLVDSTRIEPIAAARQIASTMALLADAGAPTAFTRLSRRA